MFFQDKEKDNILLSLSEVIPCYEMHGGTKT